MVQQYLLPCECGKANAVAVAQAGRRLACDCGREYTVPTLAALRQLEPVAAPVSKGKPAPGWSATRGMIFVGGVLLALIGLAAGGYGAFLIRNIDLAEVDQYFDDIEHEQLEEIDQMTPIQAYEVWQRIRVMGPGIPGSADTARVRNFYNLWRSVSVVGFIAAAAGILLAAGSLVRLPART
jgi:hypothetical protein